LYTCGGGSGNGEVRAMSSKQITVPANFTPRDYQLPFLQAMEGKQRAVMVWHRRGGKDTTCLAYTFSQMFQRVGIYYYIFPTYNQAKKVIWDGKRKDGKPMLSLLPSEVIEGSPNSTEMKINTKNGSMFQLVGSDKWDSLMGTNPVGCVFSEFSLQNPLAWEYFKPILRENGGWAVFCYTPRGHNHGYTLYEMAKRNPDWFCELLTVDDTGVFSPEDIERERAEGMSDEMIDQEYYCNWSAAMPGAYYAKLLDVAEVDGRIGRVPWEPQLPVDTFWDLGVHDATAIWFVQQVNREVRIIDYYEATGVGLPYYVKMLREKPYVFGTHNAPFDIAVTELGSGVSRLETARSLGLNFETVPKLSIEDGIEAGRNLIPRCWFDENKCWNGLQALRHYHSEWNQAKKILSRQPVKDWSNHAADSWRYIAIGLNMNKRPGYEEPRELPPTPWFNKQRPKRGRVY